MENLPFSQSCENNKVPILGCLKTELADHRRVLEVGSGTGQHAVYFAEQLSHLCWQTSDVLDCHNGIQLWISEAGLDNLRPPLELDVCSYAWGEDRFDAVFTANSLHIMPLEAAEYFVSHVANALVDGGCFIAYGPFNYQGQYTSPSNARFDLWLKQRDTGSAIRDFEVLDHCAKKAGLALHKDYEMPANNRLLVWRKLRTTPA